MEEAESRHSQLSSVCSYIYVWLPVINVAVCHAAAEAERTLAAVADLKGELERQVSEAVDMEKALSEEMSRKYAKTNVWAFLE